MTLEDTRLSGNSISAIWKMVVLMKAGEWTQTPMRVVLFVEGCEEILLVIVTAISSSLQLTIATKYQSDTL